MPIHHFYIYIASLFIAMAHVSLSFRKNLVLLALFVRLLDTSSRRDLPNFLPSNVDWNKVESQVFFE